MHRYAVILTHDRPELLRETWCAIGPQVDLVIIIDNASSPPVDFDEYHGDPWFTAVLTIPDQPPNLSALWNQGIAAAMKMHTMQRDAALAEPALIAVLCDDAPPPEGWFDAVAAAMAETGAVVGASAPEPFGWHGPPRVKLQQDSDLAGRMPGWAWILDPISPVRPDERFAYWWGDSGVDWDAREAGGMVLIGTHPVPNRIPNGWTGKMADQIVIDSQRFIEKYGWRPW